MNSFSSRSKLRVGNQEYEIYRLDALEKHGCPPARLPYSMRVLLENLLRTENGRSVTAEDIRFVGQWKPQAIPDKEIAFTPARVLMQDFTGVRPQSGALRFPALGPIGVSEFQSRSA
jgi:aconitate hydratase